uniref:Peptidase M20 dimerisation domain-containing protein n=1 Tax=Strigamia maritima TaxID=126957 RepID=T1JEU4_STRMM
MEGPAMYRSTYNLLFSLLLTYYAHVSAMASEIKMRYVISVPIFLLLLLFLICLIRTILVGSSKAVESNENTNGWQFNNHNESIHRFMEAINFETVSWAPGYTNKSEILKLHDHLVKSFPLIHNSSFITKDIINMYSLLYYVSGKNMTLLPYMLTAHLDVVPANLARWLHDPFNSVIHDEYVYGRGTIDDKHSVMGIMEALEYLLSLSYRPKRSFYIAFGHDEEVSGKEGAKKITEHLSNENVTLEFVLDEGLMVTDRILPGISQPLALYNWYHGKRLPDPQIECGRCKWSFIDSSSRIGDWNISKGLTQARDPSTCKYVWSWTGKRHVSCNRASRNFFYKFVYSNLWLFNPIVAIVMSRKPIDNALVRTTTAITLVQGGIKENVIPTSASAMINHRVHPSQTIAQVIKFDKSVVRDERVIFTIRDSEEAHPVSDKSALAYETLEKSIKQVFHNVVVAPGILTGNTDSRWYKELTKNVYRFSPSFLNSEDVKRFHGDDERILVENYFQVIQFYHNLIKNADEMEEPFRLPHDEL